LYQPEGERNICSVWGLILFVLAAGATQSHSYGLVDRLFSEDAEVRQAARDALIARNDPRIAPALTDAVFFNKNGRQETVAVLEHLLQERHGASFKKWIEAIGRREDIVPLQGYVAFKARLFSKIDPAFGQFFRDDAPRTIRPEEIVWGGVKKDGIPALDRPRFIDAASATWMTDEEAVFGVSIDGDVRAYPGRIMAWHEMANDVVGGRPVSLSYCTLCGAAILYDGKASDGRVYTFGSSGLLYRSNKLMYDRQTNSLWSQMEGKPVIGTLAAREVTLRVLPLTTTTWGEWRRRNPRTRVLSLETGFTRDYRPGAAYGHYFASDDTMFPVWKKAPSSLRTKEWVLVVNVDGARKIYPLDVLEGGSPLHDRAGRRDVVLIGERVYERDGRRFRLDGDLVVDIESGERFTIGEEALVSASGTRLHRVSAHRAYWFGAYAFYPGTEVYRSAVR
jgi:hypothetical protein